MKAIQQKRDFRKPVMHGRFCRLKNYVGRGRCTHLHDPLHTPIVAGKPIDEVQVMNYPLVFRR